MPLPRDRPLGVPRIDAKLARAETHLETIKTAIKGITDIDPDLIPGEIDVDAGRYVFRAQRDSPDPMWLGPVIGDFVHNLRAALDYLVWELVATAGTTGTSRTEFPIFADPEVYAREAPKKIRGVPPRAEAIFERLQPFSGPNSDPWHPEWREPTEEPLALLHELDKWDKHRALNLTTSLIAADFVGLERLGDIHSVTETLAGRFERGAPIATLHPAGDPDVDVYLRTAYDVAFDEDGPAGGEPVMQTLNHIRHEVRIRVIPMFRSFFRHRVRP